MSTARRGTLRRGTDYASSTCKAGASLSASPRYIMLVSKETPMPTRDEAWQLVCEYTQSESLRKHMLAVETCVRAYARKFGADEDKWGVAGLPPIASIPPRAQRFCGSTVTRKRSSARSFPMLITAVCRDNRN